MEKCLRAWGFQAVREDQGSFPEEGAWGLHAGWPARGWRWKGEVSDSAVPVGRS